MRRRYTKKEEWKKKTGGSTEWMKKVRKMEKEREVENKKNKLIILKNDILAIEISLDKTAQMFRREHSER